MERQQSPAAEREGSGSLSGAVLARDFPLIQGAVLCIATAYVVINFFVDLSYLVLDPRVRFEEMQ